MIEIHRRQLREAMEMSRPSPDPKLVALIGYAVEQISERLRGQEWFSDGVVWLQWADAWQSGRHSPGECVRVAHECFAKTDEGQIWHTLGQLCWGGKEACYSAKESPWLVIRYVADAMIAFGIAFPESAALLLTNEGPDRLLREKVRA